MSEISRICFCMHLSSYIYQSIKVETICDLRFNILQIQIYEKHTRYKKKLQKFLKEAFDIDTLKYCINTIQLLSGNKKENQPTFVYDVSIDTLEKIKAILILSGYIH